MRALKATLFSLGALLCGPAQANISVSQSLRAESVEYLEKDYPDVDWSQAPEVRCFAEPSTDDGDGKVVAGMYIDLLKRVLIDCSDRFSRREKLSFITHELIHWYQHNVVGRDAYACIGAVEAEAYRFGIKHFGLQSYGPYAWQYRAHQNLRNMANCRPFGGQQTHPWYHH